VKSDRGRKLELAGDFYRIIKKDNALFGGDNTFLVKKVKNLTGTDAYNSSNLARYLGTFIQLK